VTEWPQLSNTEIAERLGTNRRVFELRLKHYGISKDLMARRSGSHEPEQP
jgi:hypothetical protein